MVILKLLKKLLLILLKYLVKSLELIFLLIEKVIQYFSKLVSKLNWKSFVFSLFGLFATCWGFYTYYYPDVSIDFTPPLKSNNIFSSILNIRNNGNCSIYNYTIFYKISDIVTKYKNGGTYISGKKGGLISIEPLPIQNIITKKGIKSIDFDIGKILSINGSNEDGVITHNAKLTLYVSYYYWGKKFTSNDSLSFRTSRLIDNNIIWLND